MNTLFSPKTKIYDKYLKGFPILKPKLSKLVMKLSIITTTHQRAGKLQNICLPGILSQTSKNFEWIVVNDGACTDTRQVIESVEDKINIKYFETPHQGLIASRNLGLENASSALISFLDDDNVLYDNWVEKMTPVFESNNYLQMCCPIRRQRRDVYKNGECVKQGREILRPDIDAKDEDFISNSSNAWFDSNGFVHRRNNDIRFNPNLLITSDYEYLLQCFSHWGLGSLSILPEELLLYVQTNEGIIGSSNYKEWVMEFEYLWKNRVNYPIFETVKPDSWLPAKIEYFRVKALGNEALPGFPGE